MNFFINMRKKNSKKGDNVINKIYKKTFFMVSEGNYVPVLLPTCKQMVL